MVKLLANCESRLGFQMGLVWAKMWGTVRGQGGSSEEIYILIWINPALSMGQLSGLGSGVSVGQDVGHSEGSTWVF